VLPTEDQQVRYSSVLWLGSSTTAQLRHDKCPICSWLQVDCGKAFSPAVHFKFVLVAKKLLAKGVTVRTVAFMKNDVFWEVTPCGSSKNRRFGGKYRLHQYVLQLLVTVNVVSS
jgi:hypothetical protein